jgi:hypothetical protein
MDNHVGVILYLMEQLKFQEFKEAAIGYVFLLHEGRLTEQALDNICEKYLQDLQAHSEEKIGIFQHIFLAYDKDIDFECNDALEKLLRFGLVTESSGLYTAVPLREAVQKLDSIWQRGTTETL